MENEYQTINNQVNESESNDRSSREQSSESAYEDQQDLTFRNMETDSTPRASHRPYNPAAHRERRASFDTVSSALAASAATSVSVLAAQQSELLATVNRLARSVDSLSNNSVDPAHILELTDRLNMLSVKSPSVSPHIRPSPYSRQQNYLAHQQVPHSRLNGTGRMGSFPAPAAYQHQQAPRQSNIPPQQTIPNSFPSRPLHNFESQNTTNARHFPDPNTPWGEPDPVKHLLFTGNSSELRRFLVEIRDAIRPHYGRFVTDSRRINWVAQHFMFEIKEEQV